MERELAQTPRVSIIPWMSEYAVNIQETSSEEALAATHQHRASPNSGVNASRSSSPLKLRGAIFRDTDGYATRQIV